MYLFAIIDIFYEMDRKDDRLNVKWNVTNSENNHLKNRAICTAVRRSIHLYFIPVARNTREEKHGGERWASDPYSPLVNVHLGFGIRSTVPEFRSSSFNEERLFSIPTPASQRENREMWGRGP